MSQVAWFGNTVFEIDVCGNQFRRHGGFGGLSSPKKLQVPQNWSIKHYKSVDFLSNFRMSVPPAQT